MHAPDRRHLMRMDAVLQTTGLRRTALYTQMRRGLFPHPINIDVRAVAWPSDEVDAVIAARIAGKSEDELRALVSNIETQRAGAAAAHV